VNGRIVEEDSPEGRLAAVAVTVRERLRRVRPEREPDYADLEAAFRVPLELELCRARISELKAIFDLKPPLDKIAGAAVFRLRELRTEEQRLEREVARLALG
jgi:hypothetical protein